jgi:hypothetical protein
MLSTDLMRELKRMSEKIDKNGRHFGTIDPNYVSGRPRLIFDMDLTTGSLSKPYPYLASYTPAANDRVLVLSGIVIGKIMNE